MNHELFQTLRNEFSLSELRQIEKMKMGYSSETWFVSLMGGERLVVRRYPQKFDGTWIRFEYEILRYLKAHGFPVPRMFPTGKGEASTTIEGRFYGVFEYCEGEQIMWPLWRRLKIKRNEIAGKTLAWYHELMQDFLPEGGMIARGLRHEWYAEQLGRFREIVAQRRPFTRFEQYYLENVEDAEQRLSQLWKGVEERLSRCSRTVVHEDFGPSNILFRNGQIKGVIDFANARQGARVADVAYGMTEFSKWFGPRLHLGIARAFLNAYQQYFPLQAEELALLPLLMRYLRLRNIWWFLMQYYERQRPECARMFSDSLELVRWMEAHEDTIQGFCSQTGNGRE